MTPECWRK